MDRMDAVASSMRIDDSEAESALITNTDDMMMPRIDFASHPSLTSGTSSVSTSSTAPGPTAAEVKAKASSAMDSVKSKASDAMDSAKDKASDARDKAADMTDSARAKAADMADSTKAKAADLKDKMGDTAETVKEKLGEGVEKVKEGGQRLLSFVNSGLHSAEKRVEDGYEHVKDEVAAHRHPNATGASAPVVRSTVHTETTDTHPGASSMRDTHLHPGLSSLPSHDNENTPNKNSHKSTAHEAAIEAGNSAHARAVADAGIEPKDASSREGTGLLFRMHDKLEDGIEVVKDKVDGFMEAHVRTDDDHHLSAAKSEDLPTLIDSGNYHNTSQVRAKMHPSQERTVSGAISAHEQDS